MKLMGVFVASLAAVAVAGPDEDELRLLRSKVRMLEATIRHQEEVIRLLRRQLGAQPTTRPSEEARTIVDTAGQDRILKLDTLLAGLLPRLPEALEVEPSKLKGVGSRAVLLPRINEWLTKEMFARQARIAGVVEGFRYPPGRERRFRLPDWQLATLPTAPEEQIILRVRLAERELWGRPHAVTVALAPNSAWLAQELGVTPEALKELNKGALGQRIRKTFMSPEPQPTITFEGWVEGVVLYTWDKPRIHVTMNCQAPPKHAGQEDMTPLLPPVRRRRARLAKERRRPVPAYQRRRHAGDRRYPPRIVGLRR